MAFNLARLIEEEIAERAEYRHLKQPFEIKGVTELQIMTEHEKAMYVVKLRMEIQEYAQREAAYEAKRRELLGLEQEYRKVNNRGAITQKHDKQRQKTQVAMEEGFGDKLKEFERKARIQAGAHQDLREKVNTIDDQIV